MDGNGDVLLQKGESESFWVLGDLYTLFITPAGLEEFFYAIGTPASGLDTPPAFDPAVIEKVMKLAGRKKWMW